MGTRHLAALAAAVVAVTTVTVAGQSKSSKGPYVVPRTADGQPDFQGVWANNTITPLERPPQWAGKQFLNDAEMACFLNWIKSVAGAP